MPTPADKPLPTPECIAARLAPALAVLLAGWFIAVVLHNTELTISGRPIVDFTWIIGLSELAAYVWIRASSGVRLPVQVAAICVLAGLQLLPMAVLRLDGTILVCIDLTTGDLCWRDGRYGYGQLVISDDLLIIQAESGDVALVEATPDGHRELARFAALDDRTWNHPVVARDLLLVRNDREAACYRLPTRTEE